MTTHTSQHKTRLRIKIIRDTHLGSGYGHTHQHAMPGTGAV